MKNKINFIAVLFALFPLLSNLQAEIVFSKTYGLSKGQTFILPQSMHDLNAVCQIKRISVKHGQYVEDIQLKWSNHDGSGITQMTGGGDESTWSHLYLEGNEQIISVEAASGSFITQLTFYTSKRRKFGPYGYADGKEFGITLPPNSHLIGFTGNIGPAISKIGLIYETEAIFCEGEIRPKVRDHRVTGDTLVRDHRKNINTQVRDHRTKSNPEVRDHRIPDYVQVRDHRTPDNVQVKDHRTTGDTRIRDHRTKSNPEVRDHHIPDKIQVRDHRSLKDSQVRDHRSGSNSILTSRRKGSVRIKDIADGTSNTLKTTESNNAAKNRN